MSALEECDTLLFNTACRQACVARWWEATHHYPAGSSKTEEIDFFSERLHPLSIALCHVTLAEEVVVLSATSPDGWRFLILWHPGNRTGPHTSWFQCHPDGKLQTAPWLEAWRRDTEQIQTERPSIFGFNLWRFSSHLECACSFSIKHWFCFLWKWTFINLRIYFLEGRRNNWLFFIMFPFIQKLGMFV